MVNEKIVNQFNFTLKDNTFDQCNNYIQDHPNYRFVDLEQAFCKRYQSMQNDELVYLKLKNLKRKSIERVEVYYERLLKLTNSLQMLTINNFLTIVFQFGL